MRRPRAELSKNPKISDDFFGRVRLPGPIEVKGFSESPDPEQPGKQAKRETLLPPA
jgi:hypothetical protein